MWKAADQSCFGPGDRDAGSHVLRLSRRCIEAAATPYGPLGWSLGRLWLHLSDIGGLESPWLSGIARWQRRMPLRPASVVGALKCSSAKCTSAAPSLRARKCGCLHDWKSTVVAHAGSRDLLRRSASHSRDHHPSGWHLYRLAKVPSNRK